MDKQDEGDWRLDYDGVVWISGNPAYFRSFLFI